MQSSPLGQARLQDEISNAKCNVKLPNLWPPRVPAAPGARGTCGTEHHSQGLYAVLGPHRCWFGQSGSARPGARPGGAQGSWQPGRRAWHQGSPNPGPHLSQQPPKTYSYGSHRAGTPVRAGACKARGAGGLGAEPCCWRPSASFQDHLATMPPLHLRSKEETPKPKTPRAQHPKPQKPPEHARPETETPTAWHPKPPRPPRLSTVSADSANLRPHRLFPEALTNRRHQEGSRVGLATLTSTPSRPQRGLRSPPP